MATVAWEQSGVALDAQGSVDILCEPLLDADHAARLLGVPRSSIYEYARRGELPHVRIGRHLKFIRSDLERALADRRVGV